MYDDWQRASFDVARMTRRCTCCATLSDSEGGTMPSATASRPVSLSDIRFITATARSFRTSVASPMPPYAASTCSRVRSRRGGEGGPVGKGETGGGGPDFQVQGTVGGSGARVQQQMVMCAGAYRHIGRQATEPSVLGYEGGGIPMSSPLELPLLHKGPVF